MTDFQQEVFSSSCTLADIEFNQNPSRSIGKIRMTDGQTDRKFSRTLRTPMLGEQSKNKNGFPH